METGTQIWVWGSIMYAILAGSFIYLIVYTIRSIATGKGLEDEE